MADVEDPRILNFRMFDGSSWRLVGWKAVIKWLEELATFWDWMPSSPVPDPGNIRGNTPQRYQQLIVEATNLRAQGRPPAELYGYISNYLMDGYSPVHPRSERGQILNAIRRDAGDEATLFAFALLGGLVSPGNMSTPAQMRGATLAVNPELLTVSDSSAQLVAERRRFRDAMARLVGTEEEAQLDRAAEWSEHLRNAGEAGRKWSQTRARRWLRYARLARSRNDHAVQSIQTVEIAYKEQMGLAAPVKYWKDKADQHRRSERWALGWVLLFFAAALPGLAYAFNETGIALIRSALEVRPQGTPPFPNAIFLVASAGLASCAGLIFWAGRLLTKLYLSQHHLRQDAEERATMTETYLALIENRAASPDDRQVILNALFRNTPDGIVKEDGGLDPSIAAALGKFLAKP
ncbi:MAG: DUF6161 domain-containing protein [Brevundimonas sp.]